MTPDIANGMFELVGSLFLLLNCKRVLRDKRVLGFDWRVMLFFTSWGFWNLFYYPHLDQWYSFVGGVSIAIANLMYLILVMYYTRYPNDRV